MCLLKVRIKPKDSGCRALFVRQFMQRFLEDWEFLAFIPFILIISKYCCRHTRVIREPRPVRMVLFFKQDEVSIIIKEESV